MAAYNSENTIKEAIDSVLCQTYKNYELIIVDDGSNDNTIKIVNSYDDKRIVLIKNDSNLGVSLSRKKALDNSKGKYIAILDSDDKWTSDKLEKQVNLLKETNCPLIYTGSAFIDENDNKIDYVLEVPTSVTYKELLRQNILSNSSALVRKDLYLKHYSSGDNMHEDFATWLNILKEIYKAVGINEPLLIYRVSSNSKSGNKFKSAIMNFNTYRYVGLDIFSSIYYEIIYMFNGLKKYRNIK